MASVGATSVRQAAFCGRIGVCRFDITPPVGIYSRMWGAAEHETAEGIHRPLTGTALTFGSLDGSDSLALISLDLGWWRSSDDERFVREFVLKSLEIEPERLIIALTHTHSGPSTSLAHKSRPGGALIEPFLNKLRQAVVDAIRTASESAEVATLAWATGRCSLAGNRNHRGIGSGRPVVGFNPTLPAEDTLLIGRVTTNSGAVLATIVNYACHPTTLGHANRLLSPDYVGAMRDIVEANTNAAPCLFLQGASGELAPRQQYTDDVSIADQNGRVLGYAVLSTLESMLPHNTKLSFSGIVESGASLGIWSQQDFSPSELLDCKELRIELDTRRKTPAVQITDGEGEFDHRVITERVERASQLHQLIRAKRMLEVSACLWQLGDSYLIGVPAECYSDLQRKLRDRHPNKPLAIACIANGYYGYVPTASQYSSDSYEVQVSLLAEGSLEKLIETIDRALADASPHKINGSVPPPHFPVTNKASVPKR